MDNVFKLIEIVGTSEESYEKAIKNALDKASKTIKEISWFEVIQQRGTILNNGNIQYQVVVKIGFKLIV
ncbi:MAG: dodecin flavoprotein [Caldithrix sp.]|nr:dodecin flavoprotein [Caldithrix sp.]